MPLKIFLSSEMKSPEDQKRRRETIKEIESLGHIPVYFEGLPGRPLQDVEDVDKKYLAMVRGSDVFMVIVDDTVSEAMEREINEAKRSLSEGRMFYYFTKAPLRARAAVALWNSAKKGYILKEFETPGDLRKEVKRSLASYIDDVLGSAGTMDRVLLNRTFTIEPEEEQHEEFELSKGDLVTVTCTADENFYAGLFPRAEYIEKRGMGAFGFSFGTDKPQFTTKVEIPEDDDYYLVLRVGVFSGTGRIHAKVKVRRRAA